LEIYPVAGDTGDLVELLSVGDERGLVLLSRRDLWLGNDSRGDSARPDEAARDD